MPSGGGQQFQIPNGNTDIPVPAIEGIILGKQVTRGFWGKTNPDTGEMEFPEVGKGSIPTCSSVDGVTGSLYGACKKCSWSMFTPDFVARKHQCKLMNQLFVLTRERVFPIIVTIPITSQKNLRSYLASLTLSAGKPMFCFLTKLTLAKRKNLQGIDYSEILFEKIGELNNSEIKFIKENYLNSVVPAMHMSPSVIANEEGEEKTSADQIIEEE